jgi:hypothetical protein
VDSSHLSGEHSLNLIPRLNALNDREHEIESALIGSSPLPARIGKLGDEDLIETCILGVERLHEENLSDCAIGVVEHMPGGEGCRLSR